MTKIYDSNSTNLSTNEVSLSIPLGIPVKLFAYRYQEDFGTIHPGGQIGKNLNIKVSDMSSARRSRTVARPRQVAMYLSKNLTSRSLPEIGRRFGNRDHTTVIHAVKTISRLSEQDDEMKKNINQIKSLLIDQ